jgi:RimJ/RimL family protein N-acetyltransferase
MEKIRLSKVLEGDTVLLMPLMEEHFPVLHELAKEKRIWEFYPVDMTDPEKCQKALRDALTERERGTQFPFVIFHKKENRIIGSTRLMNIEPINKKLEIGWTWLHPDYWATELNFECKLLLLTFCFEEWNAVRTQLKTNEKNMRSRKAIEKIGAQFEGILRNDMLQDNGTKRNTVYFSIIDTEWPEKKERLKKLYETKKNPIAKFYE